MKHILKLLFVFSFIIIITVKAYSQKPPIWGDLKKGEYAVGFNVMYEFDHSRIHHGPNPVTGKPFPGTNSRPVRIFIWYPAEASKKPKMKYKDYIWVKSSDKRFEDYNKALSDFDYWATVNWTDGKDSSLKKILEAPVEAVNKAKALNKKFPLIIHFAGANSRRNENIPLWEYLASHGYVVMTIPELAAFGDVSMEMWPYSVTGRETQVRDMEFAMSKLIDNPNIDFTNIGTIGFSFGSVYAMRMAMYNFNIKAIATFDGNVNNKNGQNILESFFNPKIKVDWLNIYRAKYDGLDLKIFETLKYTNRYRISYTNAIHGDFEDFAMACAILPNQTPAFALKERSAAIAKKNYETTCELTLNFFNTSLKNDNASAQAFTNLVDARKSEGIISEYEHRKNAKIFDGEDLSHVIVYYGIQEAERLFEQVKNDKEYEQAVTAEDLLVMAKATRMGGRRLEKSNDILLFLEKHFPYDAAVQIEFARNYIELKKHSEARQHLQRVLKDDHKNEVALELMQGLK